MTWKEVTTSDLFRNAPPEERAEYKRQFFQRYGVDTLRQQGLNDDEINIAANEFFSRPDDTGEGLLQSAVGSAARGFLDPIPSALEVAGAYTGIESLEEFGGDVRSGIERMTPVNPAQQGFVTDAAGVLGQGVQILATGGAGAATGLKLAGKAATREAQKQAIKFGAKAAQQGAMGASAVAGGLERAEQLGLEGGDRLLAGAIKGGIEFGSEALGGMASEFGPIAKRMGIGDTVESGFMRPIIKGALTEAPEEMVAEVGGQLTDIAMAPETAPEMDFKQVAYAGLLGGVGGAMFGGVEAAVAPRTAKAFMESGSFVPARAISQLPEDIRAEARSGDDSRIVSDENDNLIGYKPKATVETELPYEAEIDVDEQLPAEVRPEVEAMVSNVTKTPETSATAAALAEDAQSGIYDLGEVDETANLLTGIPMWQPLGGELTLDAAQLEGQPIEDDQALLEQQQPTETNVPITQEALQQEQSRGQELQEPRELPILPAEPTAQAPEAAVTDQEQLEPAAAVATPAVTEREAEADAAELGQQWQDSPQFAAAEEAAAAGDMERADAIEAEWREQQKVTKDVAESGAVVDGGGMKKQKISAEPTAAVPTESLPATGQPTLGSVGVAAAPYKGKAKKEYDSGVTNGERLVESTGVSAESLRSLEIEDMRKDAEASKRDEGDLIRAYRHGKTQGRINRLAPVFVEAVDNYDIYLPQGYTRQGDLYVFNATPPQPATPATQEAQPQAATLPTVTATEESTAAQPAEAVVELTELPSYFQRNPQQKKLWDVDESYAEPARISQSVGDKIGPRGTAFTVEQLMYQIAVLREFVSNMNGRLLRGGDKGASTKELAEKWTTLRGFEALAAEYAAGNPQEWQKYRNRQNELLGLETGADVIVPYPSPDTAPLGNIGKLDRKFSKNWRVIYPNGETALFHPTALRAVSGTAETVESDVIEEVTPLTQAQAAIVDKLPELEARDAQRRGLGFDYPRARIGRLPGDQNAYISRPDQKNVGVLSPDGSIKMLSPEESTLIQGEINAFEKRQAEQIDKRVAALREEAKKQSESKLYQLTPSGPVVRRLDGKWINNNTGKPLGRSKNDQRLLSQLENNPNIESYQVVAQSTDGGVSFIPLSRAAQPAAEETGDAGVTISDSATTEGPSTAVATDVGVAESQSASARLRADIATLPAKSQAAWTPELLAIADSYYQSGDKTLLDALTAVQRKRVYANALSESDQEAFEAEQKAAFALRNPPAATYADAANDPNVFIDSLSEVELQQGIEMREKSPEPTGLRQSKQGGVTAAMDAEYMAAVERGDMEKSQRMVDEAAKASGYNVGPVYHGTEQAGLTEFYGGWFSERKDVTKEFGSQMYSAFLRGPLADGNELRKLYIEFNGDDIDPDSEESLAESEIGDAAMSGGPFSRFVQERGFQGIEVWDESNAEVGMAYSVFDPSQIKSADPVTYIDGKPVPLSQRFQPDSPDIRKSILRQNDGSVIRTGVTQRAAEAARNSYRGVIPGVSETWLGTAAEFQEQYPDGIDWGNGKPEQPDADSEAGVSADGRSYIFTDRVQLLEGDVARAEKYGTTPQGEAVKRLLRHESFGHRGAMALPAPLRNRFVDMIASGVIPEAELDYIVNERGYTAYKGWRDNPAKQIMLGEEWLAHKMEGIRAIPQSGPMAQFMDWLRDVWRWLTGGDASTTGDKLLPELRDMMREMHRALGALEPQQRVVDGTRASLQRPAQTAQDAEYLAAVERGDMETAQRIVDEAARAAGYNVGPVWHGTPNKASQSVEEIIRDVKQGNTAGFIPFRIFDTTGKIEPGAFFGPIEDAKLYRHGTGSVAAFYLKRPKMRGREWVASDPSQIKSADPVTYDDAGNIIPPSQRFQSTSPDIRYSRQAPARAQVPELTTTETKQRSQANPTLAEYEFLPDEYFTMAEAGKVDEAVTAYAIEKTKPYTKSVKGLLELRDILTSDQRIYDTFGIGATRGQAGLDYITAEAALAAEKLGNPILAETFMRINTAIGTSKGQGLAVRGLWVKNPRYNSLMSVSMIDRTAEEGSKKVTDKKLGAATAGKIDGEMEKATETARDATADAVDQEILISEKVLELGAAVQGNPKLTDKIKVFLAKVVRLGQLKKAAADMAGDTRKSIIGDASAFSKMSKEELDAAIAALEAEVAADFAALEKAIASAEKKPKAPKEAKPIETAKGIIARVQKKAASETAKAKPKLDRVRMLYKAHLRERMTEEQFNKEAIAAGLDAKTAKELYEAAELEIAAVLLSKEARGKSENYDRLTKERLKHLDVDTSALTELVNKLRREGKLGPVRWVDLMQLPATRQQVIRGTLLELVKKNPQLENLTAEEQTQLAEALETVWEKERERQFKLQVKRMELAGVAKEDAEKLVDSVPRIIKLINQGMLTEPAFYKAYGEQFGINGVSDKDRERIMELSARIYDNPSSSDTARDKQEIVDLLQKHHKLSAAEVLGNVWVAHVLSGVRTQSEMAMGVANGLLNTVKKGLDIIATNRDTESVKAAGAGLGAFFRGLKDGFMEAARYVYTEEPGLIRSDMENINTYLEDGVSKGGISTGRKLRQSENAFARALGHWLSILERVTTGWDVINYRATYEGTLAMAHKMNQKLYDAALLPTQKDREALAARAKAVLGPKATPTQVRAKVFSDIQDGIHLLGKNLEESALVEWKKMAEDFTYDAKESAYMVEPTGLGGAFYNGIMSAAQGLTAKAKKLRDDSQKELDREGNIGAIEYAFRKIFPPLLYLLAAQSRNIFGVRFIRFTGNKINELISYIPAVGLARIAFEKGMYRDGEMTVKARSVFMNNMLGTFLTGVALLKGIEDLDEDDEERGYIVNGPWDNLTPARKAQLMADGFKPNTIAFYDKKTGKWNSFNYISWPSAGILATLGSVSDYKRFTPEKWNEKSLPAQIMSGAYAGGSSFMDISSISQMTELFGRSTYSTDPSEKGLEKITRLTSGYLGGFVPRLFKDVDSMLDSAAYKPEKSWEHFAKELPYFRRSVGAPLRDIFYEQVKVSRTPWSRAFQQSPDDPAYKKLAKLNARGIWLTPPNPENRKVKRGGEIRTLTEDEAAAYMSETGAKYKEFILKRGDALAKMDKERADALIEKTTSRIREIALKRAIARGGKAVTVEVE